MKSEEGLYLSFSSGTSSHHKDIVVLITENTATVSGTTKQSTLRPFETEHFLDIDRV